MAGDAPECSSELSCDDLPHLVSFGSPQAPPKPERPPQPTAQPPQNRTGDTASTPKEPAKTSSDKPPPKPTGESANRPAPPGNRDTTQANAGNSRTRQPAESQSLTGSRGRPSGTQRNRPTDTLTGSQPSRSTSARGVTLSTNAQLQSPPPDASKTDPPPAETPSPTSRRDPQRPPNTRTTPTNRSGEVLVASTVPIAVVPSSEAANTLEAVKPGMASAVLALASQVSGASPSATPVASSNPTAPPTSPQNRTTLPTVTDRRRLDEAKESLNNLATGYQNHRQQQRAGQPKWEEIPINQMHLMRSGDQLVSSFYEAEGRKLPTDVAEQTVALTRYMQGLSEDQRKALAQEFSSPELFNQYIRQGNERSNNVITQEEERILQDQRRQRHKLEYSGLSLNEMTGTRASVPDQGALPTLDNDTVTGLPENTQYVQDARGRIGVRVDTGNGNHQIAYSVRGLRVSSVADEPLEKVTAMYDPTNGNLRFWVQDEAGRGARLINPENEADKAMYEVLRGQFGIQNTTASLRNDEEKQYQAITTQQRQAMPEVNTGLAFRPGSTLKPTLPDWSGQVIMAPGVSSDTLEANGIRDLRHVRWGDAVGVQEGENGPVRFAFRDVALTDAQGQTVTFPKVQIRYGGPLGDTPQVYVRDAYTDSQGVTREVPGAMRLLSPQEAETVLAQMRAQSTEAPSQSTSQTPPPSNTSWQPTLPPDTSNVAQETTRQVPPSA